jgi:hypothetical protein
VGYPYNYGNAAVMRLNQLMQVIHLQTLASCTSDTFPKWKNRIHQAKNTQKQAAEITGGGHNLPTCRARLHNTGAIKVQIKYLLWLKLRQKRNSVLWHDSCYNLTQGCRFRRPAT